MAQRLGAAGEDQVGLARLDGAESGVDRLHARAAIDLHREGRHRLAHAEAKRRDAGRVHLVGDDVDAAEDHRVEGLRREGLAREKRPAALHGEIDRRERPRFSPCAQERRARAIDDIDRSHAGGCPGPPLPRRPGCCPLFSHHSTVL
jgi:hypothetical protein